MQDTPRAEDHLGLVTYLARCIGRRCDHSVPFDDLYSAGCEGLMQACETFDASKGAVFATWAGWRIRSAILDHLRGLDHLSRSRRTMRKRLRAARHQVEQREQRAATPKEVAVAAGLSLDDFWGQYDASGISAPENIDQSVFADGSPVTERLPDGRAVEPLDYLAQRDHYDALHDAVDRLAPRERAVVTMIFFEGARHRQVAEHFGVVESRISQILASSLAHLRASPGLAT